MRFGRWMLILGSAVFGLVAVGAAIIWVDMIWSTPFGLTPQSLERRSLAVFDAAPAPSSAQLTLAEELTRAELRLGPQSRSAWCRLAYIQYRKAGRLDSASAESLRRSYAFGPYAADVFLWRTEFVFGNWTEAPADLKQAALRETRAFYSMWANRPKIEMMAARIRNPAGRLALELVLMKVPPPRS